MAMMENALLVTRRCPNRSIENECYSVDYQHFYFPTDKKIDITTHFLWTDKKRRHQSIKAISQYISQGIINKNKKK